MAQPGTQIGIILRKWCSIQYLMPPPRQHSPKPTRRSSGIAQSTTPLKGVTLTHPMKPLFEASERLLSIFVQNAGRKNKRHVSILKGKACTQIKTIDSYLVQVAVERGQDLTHLHWYLMKLTMIG